MAWISPELCVAWRQHQKRGTSRRRSTITRDAFRQRADSLALTCLAESRAPSASFAVIRGNDTLACGAHGLANVDSWRAPSATTIYEIGSITKQFTSAAIMKLVEQGRVKLDDDLSKYVPRFPLQGKKLADIVRVAGPA